MSTIQTRSVRRREDAKLLTGRGSYAADGLRDGMLVAALVHSPHAHATIVGIDTAGARAIPGVVGVYTHVDLTDVGPIPGGIGFPRPDGGPSAKTDRPLLAADRVRFVGEPVAVVVSRLVDKSLVAVETGGDRARFRLLEVIRQYAARCLASSGELACCQRRHSRKRCSPRQSMPSKPSGRVSKSTSRALVPVVATLAAAPASTPSRISTTPNGREPLRQCRTMSR